jgi:2-C-methyl-D-erythritol 4-phosphate cytidylyltransferase
MNLSALKGGVLNPAANKTFAAIICAAGRSSRMGGVKKEYCPLPCTDKTVLAGAVAAFSVFPCLTTIVITVPEAGEAAARSALPPGLLEAQRPKIVFVPGGETRRASVHKALSALCQYRPCYVLIHDGSRPWVSPALILRVMEAVRQYQAVIPLLPLIETPKETDAFFAVEQSAISGGPVYIKRHLCRSFIGTAQTPQAFAFREILSAHEKAAQKEIEGAYEYTDDAEVWGEFIGPVAVISGEPENRKITFPEDLKTREGGTVC